MTTGDDLGSPEHGGDRYRVRSPGRKPGSSTTGLHTAFALALGDRQAVCGCMLVTPGTRSSKSPKALKPALLERLIRLLPDDRSSEDRQRPSGPMGLQADWLGKPIMLVGGVPGPSVSFSLDAKRMWAAICPRGLCGIDSADPAEFREGYPFHRAFRDHEFQSILEVTGGCREQAASLLWSAKEAAVKALGCGFHLIDPLHVVISLVRRGEASLLSKAVMRSRFGKRVGPEKEIMVPALTFRFGNSWISVALAETGPEMNTFRRSGANEE